MKRYPSVSLLYSKHEYSGVPGKAVVLVNGEAKIYEEDFEKNNAYLSKLNSKPNIIGSFEDLCMKISQVNGEAILALWERNIQWPYQSGM